MAHPKPLGRVAPPDREHEVLYPIRKAAPELVLTHVPVIAGVNWYDDFDNPEKGSDGRWRIGQKHNLGGIRGGHCFCWEPHSQADQPGRERDLVEWWAFYDQKEEGACEGFGHSRALSLIFRDYFDAFWLYDDAQRIEGTFQPDGGSVDEGSTNRSACAALKKWGAHRERNVVSDVPKVIEREPWRLGVPGVAIKEYRWAESVDEVVAALGYPSSTTEIPLLNSWGRDGYPHRVYIPLEVVGRLLAEEGEASVFVFE